jgi:hypothetical protein
VKGWLLATAAACAPVALGPTRALVTGISGDAVTVELYGPPRACQAIDWTISVGEKPLARGRADLTAHAPGEVTFTPAVPPGAAAKIAAATGDRRVDGVIHCDDAAAAFHQ